LKSHSRTALQVRDRIARLLAAGILAGALAGCESIEAAFPPRHADDAVTPTIQSPTDVKYYRSDEPLHLGQEYFNRGIYGTAEGYFRDAVEKAPKDPIAWIGLAATYDRLARFELADRAYRRARALSGDTVQLLNNEGYSFMLRGKLITAREKFSAALRLDPDNPTILNNINLLNSSYRIIQRDP